MCPDRSLKQGSRPVSRVLSRAIIPLGPASPRASSGLPGSAGGHRCVHYGTLLPYLALLQVGFAVPSSVATDAVRSYRTVSPLPARTHEGTDLGGLLSVALSVGSRPPGVTWHLVRRSPDFPPPTPARAGEDSDCPASSRSQDIAGWARTQCPRRGDRLRAAPALQRPLRFANPLNSPAV
jgi:hypothetical protein